MKFKRIGVLIIYPLTMGFIGYSFIWITDFILKKMGCIYPVLQTVKYIFAILGIYIALKSLNIKINKN